MPAVARVDFNIELRTFRKRLRLTQEDMGRQLGIGRERWTSYEYGRANPPGDVIDGLVKMGYVGPLAPASLANIESTRVVAVPRAMRRLPVYSTIMAGEPDYQSSDLDYEEVPDWGGEFKRWGRVVSGDSMIPVLQPGDIAVFENRRYENGNVVHAFSDGEDCVKAVRGVGEGVQLWSFNDEYPPFSAHGWTVKGVCVGRIRYGKFRARYFAEFPGGLSWAMRDEAI